MVEPFSFLSVAIFVFLFFNFLLRKRKGPHLRAGDLWDRYYAHAWLFDLCWDRKDSFFDSASGCKISEARSCGLEKVNLQARVLQGSAAGQEVS